MEADKYKPGFIIYSDSHTLKTWQSATTVLIAGNAHSGPRYKEGVGAAAEFNDIRGFTQISNKSVIVADAKNHCLRLLDRTTNSTSVFSGTCQIQGSDDVRPGKFSQPWSVIVDQKDNNKLFVTDTGNKALRTIDLVTRVVSTFVKSDLFVVNSMYLTQDKQGDIYIACYYAIYKVTYKERKIVHLAGDASKHGYADSTLLDSLFYAIGDLIFVVPDMLLVADKYNHLLRIVDIKSDKVRTLKLSNYEDMWNPVTMLLTENFFYVGRDDRKTLQYIRE